ncbi:MAG: hypothetical protein LC799_02075 [Actinobacteria bacterium]|nr:hypothetical protein [Actinomycetota bacterium]
MTGRGPRPVRLGKPRPTPPPPRQTAVVILSDVLGFSASEVADMVGSSPTAVKGALHAPAQPWPATAPRPPMSPSVDPARPPSMTSRAGSPLHSPPARWTASLPS